MVSSLPATIYVKLANTEHVADSDLAPKLLSVIAEDATVFGLCDTNPTHRINCPRLLVLLLGISPWRTQAWSQARNPGEARLTFHLLNGIPAIVLPVTAQAPICAWSPWTLQQMHGDEYSAEAQYHELSNYLQTVISVGNVEGSLNASYQTLLGTGLWSMIQGARGTGSVAGDIGNVVDLKRAGIVMLRF